MSASAGVVGLVVDSYDVSGDLGRRREAASARVASLTHELADIVDSVTDANTDDEHDPEGATIAFERAQVIALLDAARAELVALDRAQERQVAGSYGVCERCSEQIPAGRLAARPSATTCVGCA